MTDDTKEPSMLRDSVARVLADTVTPRGTLACEPEGIDRATAGRLKDLGLTGSDAAGLDLDEQAGVIQALGHAGALVPYADSEALARWFALAAGFDVADDETCALALVDAATTSSRDGRPIPALTNVVVPQGRFADRIALLADVDGATHAALVPAANVALVHGHNLAGEPRDTWAIDLSTITLRALSEGPSPDAVRRRGALYRTAALIGAMTRANELSLQYALDRKQFGKPIASFQVLQAYLAEMAGELVAASAMFAVALEAEAARSRDADIDGTAEVAAAKIRAGQAARIVATLAHQIHGAMGFTQEYPLHLVTRRLWSWRDEYGNETAWARRLGSTMVAAGGRGTWERITR